MSVGGVLFKICEIYIFYIVNINQCCGNCTSNYIKIKTNNSIKFNVICIAVLIVVNDTKLFYVNPDMKFFIHFKSSLSSWC